MERMSLYDALGEMFEVPLAKAKDLIITHGWTTKPPSDATPVFKMEVSAPVAVKPAVPVATPEPAVHPGLDVEAVRA